MKVKVSEATNIQLNWAVAKCLHPGRDAKWITTFVHAGEKDGLKPFSPSTNPEQGNPIIERDGIATSPSFSGSTWVANLPMLPTSKQCFSSGPTLLIAAMRALVASKLGDEVEIPDSLYES